MNEYGDLGVLELAEIEHVTPGAGEVLIRTRAAGLNPVDSMQREGTFKALDPYEFPKVLGNELSGTVELVGAGVTGFATGDEVVARVGVQALGAFADYVSVPEVWVAKAPESQVKGLSAVGRAVIRGYPPPPRRRGFIACRRPHRQSSPKKYERPKGGVDKRKLPLRGA